MNIVTFPANSKLFGSKMDDAKKKRAIQQAKNDKAADIYENIYTFIQDLELTVEYFNFLSMNTQEQQLYFSQDGHLVPTRENDDLVGPESLSTLQYTARFAYNGTTENHMANTAGEYKNISMNQLSTYAEIKSATPMPDRIEQYGDEYKNLYTNVNGTTFQNLTVSLDFPVQFSTDGIALNIDIDGSSSNVPLADPSTPIQFTSFDGTDLYLTINGTPRKITTAAP